MTAVATMTIFDEARASAFEGRMVGMLNAGALALMISIGHRTGLFDTLSAMPPATSEAIADRAGLNERYVREWLGAMTVGGIVEHDPRRRTYRLPAEHAAFLTRDGLRTNRATTTQFLAVLGSVEDDVVACFRHGGGVPYARYRRFHDVMAEESDGTVLPSLDQILGLVPGLSVRLAAGLGVIDLGCGRGRALNQLARRFPRSRFTGYDLSEEAIAFARAEAGRIGNTNVSFVVRDLSDFDRTARTDAFDLALTFDAIHDQAKPKALLAGIRRTLAPGGVYIAQDINASCRHHGNLDHPAGPFLYTISCMHCMTVSLAQGGDGLGAMWGRETAERFLREAGFEDVETYELPHDPMNLYYVSRA